MSGWLVGGVHAYVGKTRCGKTTRAVRDAYRAKGRTGYPVCILDLAHAQTFAHLAHASGWEEVCESLFVRRTDPNVWTPGSEDERVQFWGLLAYWGGAHVVVDEIRKIANPHYCEGPFVNAVNMWGHGKLGPVTYHVTAQRPGYVHLDLWPAFDVVHVFSVARGRDAKRIEDELGLDRADIVEQPRGKYVTVEMGFPPDEGPRPEAEGSESKPLPPSSGDDAPEDRAGDGKGGAVQPDSVRALPAR